MATIYIDLDGTIVDLTKAVIEELNRLKGTNFKPEVAKSYWWEETGYPQEVFEEILREPYLFEMADSIKGAIKGVNKLYDYGFEIVFLTCPNYDSEFCFNEKVLWLEKHFDWFDSYKNVIFTARKDLVGTKDDYLIDDDPKYLNGFKGISICFEQPWSNKFNGIKFTSWDKITTYIIETEKEYH